MKNLLLSFSAVVVLSALFFADVSYNNRERMAGKEEVVRLLQGGVWKIAEMEHGSVVSIKTIVLVNESGARETFRLYSSYQDSGWSLLMKGDRVLFTSRPEGSDADITGVWPVLVK